MSKLSLFLKLFKLVPVVASDIAKYGSDRFISIRELMEMARDILLSLGGEHLYIKLTLGGEQKIIPFTEIVSIVEQLIGDVIDLDRAGIQITKDGAIHFILKPSKGEENDRLSDVK